MMVAHLFPVRLDFARTGYREQPHKIHSWMSSLCGRQIHVAIQLTAKLLTKVFRQETSYDYSKRG